MDRNKLAAQLYTVRDFTKTPASFKDTLARIAEIGYSGVQLSAVSAMDSDVSAETAKAWLDDLNLKCVATHRPWAELKNETEQAIAFHRTLDCDYVALGGIANDYGFEPDDYRRFIADAHPVIQQLKDAGIRFGLHNHAHEFMRFEGRPAYDILIDEGGPDLMLEIDTYWVIHAGVDPASLLTRCSNRVPIIHVKDKEVVQEGPIMAATGEGNLDWPGIVAAGEQAGVEWYVVEQDICPRDPFDCLRSSYEFLRALPNPRVPVEPGATNKNA